MTRFLPSAETAAIHQLQSCALRRVFWDASFLSCIFAFFGLGLCITHQSMQCTPRQQQWVVCVADTVLSLPAIRNCLLAYHHTSNLFKQQIREKHSSFARNGGRMGGPESRRFVEGYVNEEIECVLYGMHGDSRVPSTITKSSHQKHSTSTLIH